MKLIEKDERVLIYQNTQQIEAITSEIQQRANILNKLIQSGLNNDEIKEVSTSAVSIDNFIFKKQLEVNRELMRQYKAGKKNLWGEYELPQELTALRFSLMAWFNYNSPIRGGNKYQGLIFTDSWKIDTDQLEKDFEARNIKVFVQGERLNRFRKIEQLCQLLKDFGIPWNHINSSSALSKIIHATGQAITPRWQYFLND